MNKPQVQSSRQRTFTKVERRRFNPFPGLRPFGANEAHLFFGREGQSDELVYNLAKNRFVAVLGFSGSGKSSLVYCGLIPILHAGFMTQAGSSWRVVVMRPGANPIDSLAVSLAKQDPKYESFKEEERVVRRTVLSAVLRSSSLGLIDAAKYMKTDEDQNTLLLVDQFEEIFRYKKTGVDMQTADDISLFMSLLSQAVHRRENNLYVAITMRSDFIGDCSAFPELTEMINKSHYLIPQMTREQKRLAIEGPVAVGGGKITVRLVQQLLNDVGASPDQLPLLQHALMRTWQFWEGNRTEAESIDLRHYRAVGTIKEALSQHANEAYDGLTKREEKVCELMFKALTEKTGDGRGIRRPTSLRVVASIAGVSEDEATRVADRFRDPNYSLLTPRIDTPLTSSTILDISHESLMRIWTRLKTWLVEEGNSSQMYLKLAEAADRYQRGVTTLWRMPDLQLAINWREENKPTLVWGKRYHPAYERSILFLEDSERAYKNEQVDKEKNRKRRFQIIKIVAILSGFAAIVLVFLSYLSLTNAEEARRQTEIANRQKSEAEGAKVIAENSKKEADKQAEIAKKEAVRAEQQAGIAEERRQEAEAAKLVSEQSKKEADKQAKIARVQATRAEQQATIAETRRQEAEQAKEEADRLRYQAIAQSMASKVGDVRNAEQKTLIAMQSYNFYDQYGDKAYNSDIYQGLYHAYKTVRGEKVNVWEGHEAGVRCVAFSADGEKMYSGGGDGKVYAWDLSQEKKRAELLLDVEEQKMVVRSVHTFRDDQMLLVAGESATIYLYNLLTHSVRELPALTRVVYDLVPLAKEADTYVYVGDGGTVVRGDLSGAQEVLFQHPAPVIQLAASPDGQYLAFGDGVGAITLWDVQKNTGETIYTIEGGMPAHAVAFNHAGSILAFGGELGDLVFWDMEKGTVLNEVTGHYSRISHLEFSMDDRLLASSSWDNTAKIWDMDNINDLPIVLKDHGNWVRFASFSPEGDYLITTSEDNLIREWHTDYREMAANLCEGTTRNLYQKEWNQYVGEDIDYRLTCLDAAPKDAVPPQEKPVSPLPAVPADDVSEPAEEETPTPEEVVEETE